MNGDLEASAREIFPTLLINVLGEITLLNVLVRPHLFYQHVPFPRRAGVAPNWHAVKTATGKSTNVTLTPATPGQPQQFHIRIQLKRNNQDYGQLSDIVTVTVSP